uniref:Uncharacterized protein n=1 Tax=Brassica oleracea var. oleracea TaxID=109376 RepID=A0A0D3DPQ5_BRAOL
MFYALYFRDSIVIISIYWFQIYKCNEPSLSDDLLKEKATNLLVVLSGKVASATPFNCKHENDSSSETSLIIFCFKSRRLLGILKTVLVW